MAKRIVFRVAIEHRSQGFFPLEIGRGGKSNEEVMRRWHQPGFDAAIFPFGLFTVSLDGLSEREKSYSR